MDDKQKMPDKLIDIHNHLAADDPEGDKLIEIMDSFGTEVALIMGTAGHPNEHVLQAMRKHPGRFVGGAYLDPRRGAAAIDAMRNYHAEGMKVVKLFPNYGYFPDDGAFKPFFDAVAELGMAVLSHCGWLAPGGGVTAAYYSNPGRFEKVIRSHSETIFILGHAGGIDAFPQTVMLTTRTPNTFTDISPGQGLWVVEHTGSIAASIPPDRMMWGADMYYDRELIERYRKALVNIGFGEHLEKVFYSNAKALLAKIGAV